MKSCSLASEYFQVSSDDLHRRAVTRRKSGMPDESVAKKRGGGEWLERKEVRMDDEKGGEDEGLYSSHDQ